MGVEITANKLEAVLYTECSRGTFVYFIFNCKLKNKKQIKLSDGELGAYGFFKIKDIKKRKDVHPLVVSVLNKKSVLKPPKSAKKYCLYSI